MRKKLSLTQPDFATLFGVHPMTVSRWERGKAFPDGPGAHMLEAVNTQLKRRAPDPEAVKEVLKAIGQGAAIVGLMLLLAALFKGK